jgi:hypothetical protein
MAARAEHFARDRAWPLGGNSGRAADSSYTLRRDSCAAAAETRELCLVVALRQTVIFAAAERSDTNRPGCREVNE